MRSALLAGAVTAGDADGTAGTAGTVVAADEVCTAGAA